MADVIVLPGIERRDLAGAVIPSAEILNRALDSGITDVVIVGRHRDGRLYIAGESNDIDRVTGLLARAAAVLATGEVSGGIVEDRREPR